MTSTPTTNELPTLPKDVVERMAAYGITRIPVDYFHFGGFRYSNLEDAIAEAMRQQADIRRMPPA